jgi:hypothetical protein
MNLLDILCILYGLSMQQRLNQLEELGVDDADVVEQIQGCFDEDGHFVDSWGYPLPPERIPELCGRSEEDAASTSAEHPSMRRYRGPDLATRSSAWHACAYQSLN